MISLEQHDIPQWLADEVKEYFVPLPFVPETVLDIGANIGAFTKRASEFWPSAKFICCEPMPFNVSRLRRNVPAGTCIISAAIREQSGMDYIYLGENFVTGGFFRLGQQTQHKLLVECIAASSLPSCELVKIDTEGSELEILRGLDLNKTKAIFLEHHSRADAERIKAFLASAFKLICSDSGAETGTLKFSRSGSSDVR